MTPVPATAIRPVCHAHAEAAVPAAAGVSGASGS